MWLWGVEALEVAAGGRGTALVRGALATLYTLHFTLPATVYIIHCSLYTVHFTVYRVQSTLYTTLMYTVHCTL